MQRILILLCGGLVLCYGLGFMLEYSATPLGLVPVLDGREIIGLSQDIADGTLAEEPFYRAILYPGLLALMIKSGVPTEHLPLVLRAVNLSLHFTNAILVGALTLRIWRTPRWAMFAALLWGVYPVALHFAADPLDITLAITLLLSGLLATFVAIDESEHPAWLALASTCLALAALTRPQLLSVLAVWLVVSAWIGDSKRRAIVKMPFIILPAAILLASPGMINWYHAGEFRVLPWQGSYNLWAANRPGAHGRYYEQRRPLIRYEAGRNPARVEAQVLFVEMNPHAPPTIDQMNAYWRTQLINAWLAEPLLLFTQLAKKAGYLINNFEQYNNKTYIFHKQRSAWLRHNPLCWAVLFACGVAGAIAGWRDRRVQVLGLLMTAYAAAAVLTYVSARFRLPLAPLMLVLAGGLAHVPAHLRRRSWTVLGISLVIAFFPLQKAERERTFVQDELLIAKAASEGRMYNEALVAIDGVLTRDARHAQGLELDCVVRFNRWLNLDGQVESTGEIERRCERAAPVSEVSRRLLGHLYWIRGARERAIAIWRSLVDAHSPESAAAIAALIMVGAGTAESIQISDLDRLDEVLLLALALRGHAEAGRVLSGRMKAGEIERQQRALLRLFPAAQQGSARERD